MRRYTKYATIDGKGDKRNRKSKDDAKRMFAAAQRNAENIEQKDAPKACLRMRTEVTEHDDEGMTGCETIKKYVVLQVDGEPQGVEYMRKRKEKLERTVEDTEQGLGTEFYVETEEGDVPLEEYNGGDE